jgi:serine acetyltransferase
MERPQPLTLAAFRRASLHLKSLVEDTVVLVEDARREGEEHPVLRAALDPSVPALALIRGAAAMRACFGTSLGLDTILARTFDIDVCTDDLGGGLRLPHPHRISIGAGASVGIRCTLMNDVTVQDGRGTRLAEGVVVAQGAIVHGGARVGAYAHISSNSVVRGRVGAGTVVAASGGGESSLAA